MAWLFTFGEWLFTPSIAPWVVILLVFLAAALGVWAMAILAAGARADKWRDNWAMLVRPTREDETGE